MSGLGRAELSLGGEMFQQVEVALIHSPIIKSCVGWKLHEGHRFISLDEPEPA